uniref:KH type-2 domain-containing protein n=1 Tax=Rhinopithecus bieti TaxID=61621 RepID=A0A2K6MF27_RHIBE
MAVQISKKRKFVADGIFKTELNEFLTWELAEDGYSGVEVTEIIILATRTQNVLGEKGQWIQELTGRFGFPEGSVELYCAAVPHGELDQRLRGRGVWETPRTEG